MVYRIIYLVQNVSDDDISLVRAKGLTSSLSDGFKVQIVKRRQQRNLLLEAYHFWKQIVSFRPNIIYCQNEGLTALIPAVMAKLLYKISFIIDTGDIAEILARKLDYSLLNRWKIILTERLSFRLAICIVVRGTYFQKYLNAKGFNNVCTIRDGVDIEMVASSGDSKLRKHLGLENYFVIGVMGKSYWNKKYRMCYGWDLIEVVGLLRYLPIKGLMIGDGDGILHLKQRAGQLGISEKIIFTGYIQNPEVRNYLKLIDVALSTQTNDIVGWCRTTGKLPEYLAAGCFVIASAVGEATLVLPPEMLITYDSEGRDDTYPYKLAERIEKLYQKKEFIISLRERSIDIARNNFDYRILSRRLQACLAKNQVKKYYPNF